MKATGKQHLSIVATLVALALAGCGSNKQAATQVAAQVGNDEISVHQVNHALARMGGVDPAQAKQASDEILERLIDQQVLIQKAVENQLDRDPQVIQNLEAARRQILSQAYLDKVTANSKPSPDERRAFYAKHPELFAERRIYRFNELSFSPNADMVKDLESVLGKAKTLTDVTNWLRAQNVSFTAGSSVRPAEQLPVELAPRIHQMKNGQMTVLPGQGTLVVLHLATSQQVPVSEQEAEKAIDQYLQNEKRNSAAQAEVKKLRDAVKVDYQGEFAKAKEAPKAAAEGAKPGSDAAKPAEAPATVAGGDAISKGISGLK